MEEYILPKSWSIKRMAKWLKLFIFTIASLLALFVHIMEMADYSWVNFKHSLIIVLVTYPVVIIAWLTVFPAAILKKRVPKTIALNHKGTLEIIYSINRKWTLEKTDYAFTYHRYELYSVFIVYRRLIAKREHTVWPQCLAITGLTFGKGWNTKRLDEIVAHLTSIGIENIPAEDKPFLSRLIE